MIQIEIDQDGSNLRSKLNYRSRECGKKCEIKRTHVKNEILKILKNEFKFIRNRRISLKNGFYLVEKIQNKNRSSGIIQVSMDEESASEEPEFSETKIGRDGRIATLLPEQTEANMSLLYHGHVIGSVADRRRHGIITTVFHHFHNLTIK